MDLIIEIADLSEELYRTPFAPAAAAAEMPRRPVVAAGGDADRQSYTGYTTSTGTY